jgi:Ca2+-binding EF-hand superfamily protein
LLDKIDVDDLIKDFKVLNIENFIAYLKEVFRDLAERSDEKVKGINKVTFSKYYELPGLISERLFAVFDQNKNGFIDLPEFLEGMNMIFADSHEKMMKFIFNLYDFDKDGLICKEDVRVVLSYIPLNTKDKMSITKSKYEKEEFKDRVESQDELHILLQKCFGINEKLDYTMFTSVIEKISSDIYLFILIFLLERKPFSDKTLNQFEFSKMILSSTNVKVPSSTLLTSTSRLIASPNLLSKFSPSLTISKSPSLLKRTLESKAGASKDLLNKIANKAAESKNILSKYTSKKTDNPLESKMKIIEEIKELENGDKNVAVLRKNRNNLKNMEDFTKTNIQASEAKEHLDLEFTPAVKLSHKTNMKFVRVEEPKGDEEDDNSDEDIRNTKFESSIFKITHTRKLKKLWFKLIGKDIYYYKHKDDKAHKGMHNLSGVFVKEELKAKIDDSVYFCFSVIYPKKKRIYYIDNEDDYKNWIKYIKKVTGYSTLTDIYEVKEKLGNGKFGLVRLGIHKETKRKVAIKIMSKKEMNNQDLDLVKTEIEILKIGQHPNIIRLYDVFENLEFIYIIMEFCSGGDLFSYLEKRGFKLSEHKTASIIHKLATAVFYLHSYGIAHRDLKPENILMTDSSDDADIRLLDFGLSKLVGPNETCKEPFGTLSYVAPEILLEKPYTKAVDLWSIGVISYLMLSGFLPFDDESSEREIARQTIREPVRFPSQLWKYISSDAKKFVDNLLSKDPSKRMQIKEVLEHPWILKNTLGKVTEMRTSTNFKEKSYSMFKHYATVDDKILQ